MDLPDYSIWQWCGLWLTGLLTGVAKTGVPGISIINVPLMANLFPAKMSTGLVLPILGFTDILAVIYYHRHAKWNHIFRLLPWALAGIVAGSVIIRFISDDWLKPVIGFIVLIMLVLNYWRRSRGGDMHIPTHWSFAASMGFAAGLTTQLANAAGPVIIIYMLAMRLPKEEFIGTSAWYFLILNWLKIPLFISEDRITVESFTADLTAIPFLIIGAVAGIIILKKIPQIYFEVVVQILAVAAALKLCASAFFIGR
jgi:uncharacterized membrane protein YfcA